MHSLRVSNLPLLTTEAQIREEFEVYGQLGDVYRPIDKDTLERASGSLEDRRRNPQLFRHPCPVLHHGFGHALPEF